MFIKRGKRGAIEMEYIVIVVVLVIAFIALAYALVRFDVIGLGKDSACKLSILAKATAPTWLPNVAPSIPIECVTKKICLGGECKENFEGEKDIEKINLDKDAKTKIEKAVADEFYNCWDNYGRGKLDIFGSLSESVLATAQSKPRCVICSRIALDKNASREVVGQVNIKDYMINNKPKGSNFNYLKTLEFGSDSNLDARNVESSKLGLSEENPKKSNELAVVFMQISAPAKGKAGTTLLGGGIVGGGSLAFVGSRLVTGSGSAIFRPILTSVPGALAAISLGAFTYAGAELSAVYNRGDAAAYCGTYKNGKDSLGCTVVQIMPYDRSSINSLCEVIEGDA